MYFIDFSIFWDRVFVFDSLKDEIPRERSLLIAMNEEKTLAFFLLNSSQVPLAISVREYTLTLLIDSLEEAITSLGQLQVGTELVNRLSP